jgi:hypothetical protein
MDLLHVVYSEETGEFLVYIQSDPTLTLYDEILVSEDPGEIATAIKNTLDLFIENNQ